VAFLAAVMSRATTEMPTTAPALSVIGATVKEASTGEPSWRTRRPS
jgi:hypothetical protein